MKTSKLAEFKVSQLSCKLLRADTVWTYFSFLPVAPSFTTVRNQDALSSAGMHRPCWPALRNGESLRNTFTKWTVPSPRPATELGVPSSTNTCRYNLNFSWWSSSRTSVCSLIWGSLFSGPKLISDGCLCCAECWVNGVLPDSLQEKIRRSVGGPWAPGHEDRTSALFPLD